jgi:hypothetical protein
MDKRDPVAALAAHYAELGKREAPPTLSTAKPVGRLGLEILKFASALAAGIAIVLAATGSALPTPTPSSQQVGQVEEIRRQIVQSGLNPDEILDTPRRHSERTGETTWHA